jgi:magnesium-protoporphyrin O-methyltransferase
MDARRAQKELKRYQEKGPEGTTSMLLQALISEGVDGLALLDIGGGVGVLQHELLQAGVRGVTSVDASSAYLQAAKEEVERRGLTDRVQQHHGDFVQMAHRIPQAGIVTLDRVICCYHDMEGLVDRSAALASKLYGVVYPRDDW